MCGYICAGGERKRLSIGVEIIALPDLVFLDEPTSGLDSEIAVEVMGIAKALTMADRTVLATIHQPSKEIVAMFDLLLLMARGRVIYFGPMADAVPFFTSAPYYLPFERNSNPADFVLKVSGEKLIPGAAAGAGSAPFSSGQLADIFEVSELGEVRACVRACVRVGGLFVCLACGRVGGQAGGQASGWAWVYVECDFFTGWSSSGLAGWTIGRSG